MALCRGDREIQRALDAEVADVVRHPVDWRLLLHRIHVARRRVETRRHLAEAHRRLDRALDVVGQTHDLSYGTPDRDRLTELPGREAFLALADRALAAGGGGTAVLVVAIDRFDAVNEALGREGGDQVLASVGRAMRGVLSNRGWLPASSGGLATAALARLSGVHFGVVTTHAGGAEGASRVAHQLLSELCEPIEGGGQTVHLVGSAGAALHPNDGDTAEQLVRHAEAALVEARRLGGGILRFYCSSLNEGTTRKLAIDRMLRTALRKNQLEVHYQPLVEFHTGRIVGAEALVRWRHPDHGLIQPQEFIPVAEETGLMAEISNHTLDVATRQLREWRDQGFDDLGMAVNLSLCQFRQGDLVRRVRDAIVTNGLRPESLELEISERGVLSGDLEIIEVLRALKELGVRLSLDDFGTGDSSISYLKDFPVDSLKIDKSFVAGALDNNSDSAITSAMADIGRRLSLRIIAEGIETDHQLELLKGMGCHQFQGFLFSPAVASQEFRRLLSVSDPTHELGRTLPFPRRSR